MLTLQLTGAHKLVLLVSLPLSGFFLYLLLRNRDDDDDEPDERSQPRVTTTRNTVIEVKVPQHAVGAIIGTKGSNIKQMQEETGARINMKDNEPRAPPPADGTGNDVPAAPVMRTVIIRGTSEQAQQAENLVRRIVAEVPVKVTDQVHVPVYAVGRIIGKQGSTISEIARVSKAKVTVERRSPSNVKEPTRLITLIGIPEAIANAKDLIQEKLDEEEANRARKAVDYGSRTRMGQQRSGAGDASSRIKYNTTDSNLPSSQEEQGDTPISSKQQSALWPESNEYMSVYVSSVATPDNFWVQLVTAESHQLDKLNESLLEYCNAQSKNHNPSWRVGELVAAPYEDDGTWFRAEIMEDCDDGKLDLYSIDYGDSIYIDATLPIPLPAEFSKLKPQARECCLYGVEPTEDSWSEKAVEVFEEITHTAKWRVVQALACGQRDKVIQVKIVDTNSEKDIDIAKHLVQLNLARWKEGCAAEESASSAQVHAENDLKEAKDSLPLTHSTPLVISQSVSHSSICTPLTVRHRGHRYCAHTLKTSQHCDVTMEVESEKKEDGAITFLEIGYQHQVENMHCDQQESVKPRGELKTTYAPFYASLFRLGYFLDFFSHVTTDKKTAENKQANIVATESKDKIMDRNESVDNMPVRYDNSIVTTDGQTDNNGNNQSSDNLESNINGNKISSNGSLTDQLNANEQPRCYVNENKPSNVTNSKTHDIAKTSKENKNKEHYDRKWFESNGNQVSISQDKFSLQENVSSGMIDSEQNRTEECRGEDAVATSEQRNAQSPVAPDTLCSAAQLTQVPLISTTTSTTNNRNIGIAIAFRHSFDQSLKHEELNGSKISGIESEKQNTDLTPTEQRLDIYSKNSQNHIIDCTNNVKHNATDDDKNKAVCTDLEVFPNEDRSATTESHRKILETDAPTPEITEAILNSNQSAQSNTCLETVLVNPPDTRSQNKPISIRLPEISNSESHVKIEEMKFSLPNALSLESHLTKDNPGGACLTDTHEAHNTTLVVNATGHQKYANTSVNSVGLPHDDSGIKGNLVNLQKPEPNLSGSVNSEAVAINTDTAESNLDTDLDTKTLTIIQDNLEVKGNAGGDMRREPEMKNTLLANGTLTLTLGNNEDFRIENNAESSKQKDKKSNECVNLYNDAICSEVRDDSKGGYLAMPPIEDCHDEDSDPTKTMAKRECQTAPAMGTEIDNSMSFESVDHDTSFSQSQSTKETSAKLDNVISCGQEHENLEDSLIMHSSDTKSGTVPDRSDAEPVHGSARHEIISTNHDSRDSGILLSGSKCDITENQQGIRQIRLNSVANNNVSQSELHNDSLDDISTATTDLQQNSSQDIARGGYLSDDLERSGHFSEDLERSGHFSEELERSGHFSDDSLDDEDKESHQLCYLGDDAIILEKFDSVSISQNPPHIICDSVHDSPGGFTPNLQIGLQLNQTDRQNEGVIHVFQLSPKESVTSPMDVLFNGKQVQSSANNNEETNLPLISHFTLASPDEHSQSSLTSKLDTVCENITWPEFENDKGATDSCEPGTSDRELERFYPVEITQKSLSSTPQSSNTNLSMDKNVITRPCENESCNNHKGSSEFYNYSEECLAHYDAPYCDRDIDRDSLCSDAYSDDVDSLCGESLDDESGACGTSNTFPCENESEISAFSECYSTSGHEGDDREIRRGHHTTLGKECMSVEGVKLSQLSSHDLHTTIGTKTSVGSCVRPNYTENSDQSRIYSQPQAHNDYSPDVHDGYFEKLFCEPEIDTIYSSKNQQSFVLPLSKSGKNFPLNIKSKVENAKSSVMYDSLEEEELINLCDSVINTIPQETRHNMPLDEHVFNEKRDDSQTCLSGHDFVTYDSMDCGESEKKLTVFSDTQSEQDLDDSLTNTSSYQDVIDSSKLITESYTGGSRNDSLDTSSDNCMHDSLTSSGYEEEIARHLIMSTYFVNSVNTGTRPRCTHLDPRLADTSVQSLVDIPGDTSILGKVPKNSEVIDSSNIVHKKSGVNKDNRFSEDISHVSDPDNNNSCKFPSAFGCTAGQDLKAQTLSKLSNGCENNHLADSEQFSHILEDSIEDEKQCSFERAYPHETHDCSHLSLDDSLAFIKEDGCILAASHRCSTPVMNNNGIAEKETTQLKPRSLKSSLRKTKPNIDSRSTSDSQGCDKVEHDKRVHFPETLVSDEFERSESESEDDDEEGAEYHCYYGYNAHDTHTRHSAQSGFYLEPDLRIQHMDFDEAFTAL